MAKEYVMQRELKAQEEENKNVDHLFHYNRDGAMECIDEMVLIFGKEAVKNFCLCNAWKYRYRAADKNGEEDLRKSDWYLEKYKELNSEETIKENPYWTITVPFGGVILVDKSISLYKNWEEQHWWRDPVIYCNTAPGPSTVTSDKTN